MPIVQILTKFKEKNDLESLGEIAFPAHKCEDPFKMPAVNIPSIKLKAFILSRKVLQKPEPQSLYSHYIP